jgi:hypothetical protein
MAIPCGYGVATLIVLMGSSLLASPITIACAPMQVRYQYLPSSEKTTSSPTTHPGTATTLLMLYGVFFISITRSSGLPSAVT